MLILVFKKRKGNPMKISQILEQADSKEFNESTDRLLEMIEKFEKENN